MLYRVDPEHQHHPLDAESLVLGVRATVVTLVPTALPILAAVAVRDAVEHRAGGRLALR